MIIFNSTDLTKVDDRTFTRQVTDQGSFSFPDYLLTVLMNFFHVLIVIIRVMVIQIEFLDPGSDCRVDRIDIAGVSPASFGLVIFRRVLGIVNKNVRSLDEF